MLTPNIKKIESVLQKDLDFFSNFCSKLNSGSPGVYHSWLKGELQKPHVARVASF